jgi:hypothetical protein
MNGYAFIASIFQSIVSLAWPVAIVIIVWMLRRRIEELLPNLRAKYKDFEISLRLDRAEKEIAALPPPASAVAPDPGPTPEETDRFEQMASVSPRAAITEVRRDLEEALDRLVRQHGLVDRIRPMSATIHLLSSKGIIDPHSLRF